MPISNTHHLLMYVARTRLRQVGFHSPGRRDGAIMRGSEGSSRALCRKLCEPAAQLADGIAASRSLPAALQYPVPACAISLRVSVHR
jgi:hypothetical protein